MSFPSAFYKGIEMKPAILFFLIISSAFTGCSTTYYLKDSRSEENFYADYNKSASKKNIEVILNRDSIMCYDNHSVIRNDTLYIFERESEEKRYHLPTGEIRSIHYITHDFKNADLVLNTGIKLNAESIFISGDSVSFNGTREWINKKPLVRVDEIKNVSYKDHLRGVIHGVLGGILLGGALGATGWIIQPPDGHGQIDHYGATLAGAFSGLIIGGVVGYLIGFNVNYQFNPGR